MTLALLNISKYGIAFAADSALTWTESNGNRYVKPDDARKVFAVPSLNAGLVAWGHWFPMKYGGNPNVNLETILNDFVVNHRTGSLGDFAKKLEETLRNAGLPDKKHDYPTIGVQLAGYTKRNGVSEPLAWHIHDGKSQRAEEQKLAPPNARVVNANNDYTPQQIQEVLGSGKVIWTRNGDFRGYAMIHDGIIEALDEFACDGLTPLWSDVYQIASFLGWEVDLVAGLFRQLNRMSTIAGTVRTLAINADGVVGQVTNWTLPKGTLVNVSGFHNGAKSQVASTNSPKSIPGIDKTAVESVNTMFSDSSVPRRSDPDISGKISINPLER